MIFAPELEPYLNTVTHGDCLEVMARLPEECVDMIFTGPPYGHGNHDGANRKYTMVAVTFTAYNKQSKHRAQSRPRPSANCRFDGSVGVHSVAKPPSGTVMSPMRQLLAFVKR
jgi:hypothetical protein